MEALRLVPGVLVSKINQNSYAVSIRGFNRRQVSDKLLVLMDGRTIYSPSAAGVFWIEQDTALVVLRIFVDLAPLCGALTPLLALLISLQKTLETQGVLASIAIETEEEGFATLR